MPYRPLHSQSRVEYIKKKFENSFSEENETGPLKYSSATIPYKTKVLKELKDLNLDKNEYKKNNYQKDETAFVLNDVNKTEGKSLIKRTPAFRREKLGCAKSLTQITPQKFLNADNILKNKGNERETQNQHVKFDIFKNELAGVNTCVDIKRSKTDTNLLKYCTSRNNQTILRSPSTPNTTDSLKIEQNVSSLYDVDSVNLPQYSVINKNKDETENKEEVNLKFSESIRRALQSPLPKGPPPKKPPRTFCHIPQSASQRQNNKNCEINCKSNTDTRPVIFKADIPKLKSKLEKLENAIKIHETGAQFKRPNENSGKSKDKILKKPETDSGSNIVNTAQSCLPLSSCLSQGTSVNNFKKILKTKSEFYLDVSSKKPEGSRCEKNKECCIGATCEEIVVKISSAEAIYDLPFTNQNNHFETFGKSNKYFKECETSKKTEESLHYMCTDVVKQTPKLANFFSSCDRRKSLDGGGDIDTMTGKANSLIGAVKQMSSSMSRIDDRKLASDIRVGKESEKERNVNEVAELLSSALCEECSVESGPESSAGILNSPAGNHHLGCQTEKVSHGIETGMETEGLSEIAAKRKFYVSRVSSKLVKEAPYWKCKNSDSYTHLFEYCLLVGLTLCESKQNVPYIKSIFPPDMKPPPLIESLCFPDASYWPPNSEDQQPEEQYYSLVVTNESGERKFGYCRRVLPEGGHLCLPLTYCIITPHRAGGFFYKVLEELESRHGSPGIEKFIGQLYESQFPGPGERLKLRAILEEAARITPPTSDLYLSSTLVRRPCDVRLEEKDLTQLLQHLELSVFLKVFSSLLHERKVLLLSNSLRKLSSCIEALQSVLLPFSWQHTYIPVLPVHLIEMCEAPTPYVIGLLKPKNVEKSLSNVNFEDGILVDLDDSKIIICCGDEGSILPQRFKKDLKTSLNLALSATDLSDSVRSVLLSDAFIRFFVQVCGNYTKFILNLSNGERIFQKNEFIKSATSNATHSFLEWFTETAMFTSFIQERLQGDEEDSLVKLFRLRALEYSGENVKDCAAVLKNYRVINKKTRTLSDKIKDFTSFTK